MSALDTVRDNARNLPVDADHFVRAAAAERHASLRRAACTCRPLYGSHNTACALRGLCDKCCASGIIYVSEADTSVDCSCEFAAFPWRRRK